MAIGGGRQRDRRRGRRQRGVLGADLDQELPVAPRRLGRAPPPRSRCGRWWPRRRAPSGRAGCAPPPSRRGCTSGSSASSRPNVSALGSPPTRRVAAAWNSSPRRSSRSSSPAAASTVLAGGDRFRQRPGQEAHHREAERRVRALGRIAGQWLSACSMRATRRRACGPPTSAAPRSSRISRRSAVGASSSSARRRNRTAWSGEAALARAPRGGGQRVERPRLADRAGGPGGEEVGRRALPARRVTGELARGAQMELRPLRRRGRAPASACWTIGWTNRGGSRGYSSSNSISASIAVAAALAPRARDVRCVRQRRIVTEDRERPRDGSRPPGDAGSAGRRRTGPPTAAPSRRSRARRGSRSGPPSRSSREAIS